MTADPGAACPSVPGGAVDRSRSRSARRSGQGAAAEPPVATLTCVVTAIAGDDTQRRANPPAHWVTQTQELGVWRRWGDQERRRRPRGSSRSPAARHTRAEAEQEVGPSLPPVLAARDEEVDDAMRAMFPAVVARHGPPATTGPT